MSQPGESTGPLSIDQAAAALELPRKEPEAQEAAEQAAPEKEEVSTADPTAEDASGAETQTDGEEAGEVADTEAEEANQAAIDPPKFWDADSKERFKALPPEVQEIIVRKEDERNTAVARSMQDSAEKRKVYDAETSRFQQLAATLDKQLPQAVDALKYQRDAFNQKWANVDWIATIDQFGGEFAQKKQIERDAELAWLNDQSARIQQLQTVKEVAEKSEFQKFVAEEGTKLAQLSPELTDPKLGNDRKQALGKFLLELGVPAKKIPHLTAIEAALAYDAMQWRNGKATAKRLVTATPIAAQVKRSPVKTAGNNSGTTQQTRLGILSKQRELSVDEAVELSHLKGSS